MADIQQVILDEVRDLRDRYNEDIPAIKTDIALLKVSSEGRSAVRQVFVSVLPKLVTACLAVAAFVRSL